jgi:hypothetical protein
MRLLVTRPEPDNARTAAALRANGHEVMLAPLLHIEAVTNADLGAPPWAAILLTSANGARAIADHPRRAELIALPVLAVGRSSADAARAAGFTDVSSRGSRPSAFAECGSRCFISRARTGPVNWWCRVWPFARRWSTGPPRLKDFRLASERRWSSAASTVCCISRGVASRATSIAAATSAGWCSSPCIIACRRGQPPRLGPRALRRFTWPHAPTKQV